LLPGPSFPPSSSSRQEENKIITSQNKRNMAPPSQLAIATGSVQRLVKEEVSYHKELVQQEARLKKLEESKDEDENAEFVLKQEVGTHNQYSSYDTRLDATQLEPAWHCRV
jgi:hypothetical protein